MDGDDPLAELEAVISGGMPDEHDDAFAEMERMAMPGAAMVGGPTGLFLACSYCTSPAGRALPGGCLGSSMCSS